MQQPQTWQSRRHGLYEEYTYEMQFIFSVQPRANTFLFKGQKCSPRFGLGEPGRSSLGLLTTIIGFTFNPAVASQIHVLEGPGEKARIKVRHDQDKRGQKPPRRIKLKPQQGLTWR